MWILVFQSGFSLICKLKEKGVTTVRKNIGESATTCPVLLDADRQSDTIRPSTGIPHAKIS